MNATVAKLQAEAIGAAATVTQREPLMLPAPAETIEIPGMNIIAQVHERLTLTN